jgi:putative spermidine/putrescine transport system substrate-binding protein
MHTPRNGRRSFLINTGAVMLSPGLLTLPARAYAAAQCGTGVRVGCPGGEYLHLLQQNVDPLLVPAGLVPAYDAGSGLGMQTKMRAEIGGRRSTLDVVILRAAAMYQAHADGTTAPFNAGAVPNLSRVVGPLKLDYAVPQAFTALVLVYAEGKFKTAPTGLDALLDPASKGRIGIGRGLAAALPLAGALAAGKTPGDAEAANGFLQALKQQSPTIYASGDELAAAFKSGEVWAAVAWKADMLAWKKNGTRVVAIVPKEGMVAKVFQAAQAAGSRDQACAAAYLNALLDPAAQRAFAQGLGYAPVIGDAAGLPPEVQDAVGFSSADVDRLVKVDENLLAKNHSALADSWRNAFGVAI